MNRKEQISDTAERFYLNNEQNNYDDERLSKAFIRGAEWADEHPKDKRQLLTDEMIIKIINLYNSWGVDKVDENSKVLSVETIKKHLYES